MIRETNYPFNASYSPIYYYHYHPIFSHILLICLCVRRLHSRWLAGEISDNEGDTAERHRAKKTANVIFSNQLLLKCIHCAVFLMKTNEATLSYSKCIRLNTLLKTWAHNVKSERLRVNPDFIVEAQWLRSIIYWYLTSALLSKAWPANCPGLDPHHRGLICTWTGFK